jgi:hypothetical protein
MHVDGASRGCIGPLDHGERAHASAWRRLHPRYLWTINGETTINELLNLGVHGLMSDRLRLLRDVLTRRGLRPTVTGTSAEHGASTTE